MMRQGWRRRGAAIGLCVGFAGMTGCEKPAPPPEPTCRPPTLVATPSPTPEDTAHDALFNCVKQAAFQQVSRGGAVQAAAESAASQCAPAQAAYLKAIAATRTLYAYERGVILEQVAQVAKSTAVQKRSRGCGRPGGEVRGVVRDLAGSIVHDCGTGELVSVNTVDRIVEVQLAGGSGFGDPRQRAQRDLERDVADGYVSADVAGEAYGGREAVA